MPGRHTLKTLNENGIKEFADEIKEEYRVDPDAVLEEMLSSPAFSNKRWQKSYREQARAARFGEANSASAFSQVLRYGITRLAAEGYELEPSVFENEIAEVVPSKGFENYYAPFFRPGRGGPVERGQAYPEVKMSGLNVTIRNYKFGSILEIERELVDDDQTGEVITARIADRRVPLVRDGHVRVPADVRPLVDVLDHHEHGARSRRRRSRRGIASFARCTTPTAICSSSNPTRCSSIPTKSSKRSR